MKRALLIASVASMIEQFNMNNIQLLQNGGYEVHVAANFICGNTCSDEQVESLKKRFKEKHVYYYQIDFIRNPFKVLQNYNAYNELKKIEKNCHYDLIHCHSPIGGLLGRFVFRKCNGTTIIYTAHGFHFYKGAPLLNWLLYYPVERICAHYTDILITINHEDYQRAKHFTLHDGGKVYYVSGVGIDTHQINEININRETKCKELGISPDTFIILSVGELNKNKNHEIALKAVAKLKNKNFVYLICGQGDQLRHLKVLSQKLGINDQVIFLGYRFDVFEIYKIADVFLFPSFREGLPVAVMEAMAAGLPIVCSDIRGNNDLILNEKNGYLVYSKNINAFTDSINILMNNKKMQIVMGQYSKQLASSYDKKCIMKLMYDIYFRK
ncbi:hypothetical protein AB840_01880 [Megasphaera cerevisiae DSM 20462]|uniref:Glycosyl transferase family 1 n=1 Tax=Megasphaera cerevisiae DSM 20462 TaxID=1122219 RepID=A0A0J6ZRT4_9FIRM|nr:glycosyltransferase family 4 protein [Megasphaera cerevisiae]KMO87666.1 hypothetical protein AB840_01880 [Megasphaera cerevisiae DSM 20462]SKA06784.1 Glycosyltransferase involved in cell wall bisynthesis [Megasphaera cerevisiae DSM 20462]